MTNKNNSNSKLILIGLVSGLALLAAGVVFFPVLYQAARDYYHGLRTLALGQPAPDFQAQTLTGETVKLSQFRGQPVVLTLGATWCPDCQRQTPLLNQLHEAHPNLVILDIDVKESEEVVREYVGRAGIHYPVIVDTDGSIARSYQLVGYPSTFILDSQGIIRARLIERVTTENLAQALKSAGTPLETTP